MYTYTISNELHQVLILDCRKDMIFRTEKQQLNSNGTNGNPIGPVVAHVHTNYILETVDRAAMWE